MVDPKIEFRKIRDFGENLNDTLTFIRQNFKPLLQSFFAICGIFMIAQAIFNGLYQSQYINLLSQMFKVRSGRAPSFSQIFNLEYALMLLFLLITMVSMQVALGAYIKYYVQHEGLKPGIDEVWSIFQKYFLKMLLYTVPLGIMILIGSLFCVLPGIYLWVVFVPFPLIIMIEDKDFGDSWQRCFELIKENFWSSLAIYLVAYLIYSLSGGIIGFVVSIIIGIGAYFTTDDIGATFGIATSFLNIFSFCFYIIFFICITFHYFTLVEKKMAQGY